jgi:hypothetical protein
MYPHNIYICSTAFLLPLFLLLLPCLYTLCDYFIPPFMLGQPLLSQPLLSSHRQDGYGRLHADGRRLKRHAAA